MSGTPKHRAVALAAVAGWLNNRVVGEYIDREREARGEDAELFASTAEWRRLEARANERGITGDERSRCCDDMRVVRDKIAGARPTTLRGVLAALEMASEVNDSDLLARRSDWAAGDCEAVAGERRRIHALLVAAKLSVTWSPA
jgi:hypothetical protein